MAKFKIEGKYYPIVYVRGYAMTPGEREDVFHDAYYGLGVTSVEKRQAPPPKHFEADLFEGLLIRLIKDHAYVDSTNKGYRQTSAVNGAEQKPVNPSRSIWVSRFYDDDYFTQSIRSIEDHAIEVCGLISDIRRTMKELDVDTTDFKVILIAHSMGGLVCRALIQKSWGEYAKKKNKEEKAGIDPDPKSIIHRFVTMGTPHRGIDLGAVPDFVENTIVTKLNPFGASIFKDERMREYLDLSELKNPPKKKSKTPPAPEDYVYDVHSIGPSDRFPVKRCLCLIGSDWNSYGVVKKLTGGVSDGLVKQSRAYLVSGPRPELKPTEGDPTAEYDDANRAFWANVHRAHSGYRGIVNSYESYENIQRFLFGDTIFHIKLEKVDLRTERDPDDTYIYDFEFLLSIRGTAAYLHRRQQDPCENAHRVKIDKKTPNPPTEIFLHTGFMNSELRADKENDPYSYFRLRFQIVERHVKKGFLWDHDYPASVIYSESMDARVGADGVEYRWLSDAATKEGWTKAERDGHAFRVAMRPAAVFSADLVVRAGDWPDQKLTLD